MGQVQPGWKSVFSRAARIVVEIIAAVVAGTAILLALAAWRLSTSPVSLEFLTPSIEEALSAKDGAFIIRLERTLLTWGGWDRTLDIRVRGVRALGPSGAVIATVPELSVSLSTRALIKGLIAPTRIEALGPRVRLVRGIDDRFEFAVGAETGQGTGVVEALLAGLLAQPDPERAVGYLSRVSVLAANIRVEDQKLEKSWNLPAADLTLVRDPGGLRGTFAFDAEIDGQRPHFDVDLVYDRGAEAIDFRARFQALDARLLVSVPRVPALLEGVDTAFDGTVSARLELDGNIRDVRFDLAGGPGRLRLPAPIDIETRIKATRFRGQFADEWRQLKLEEAFIDFDGPRIAATGFIDGLDGEAILEMRATVSALSADRIDDLWPRGAGGNARAWVTRNVSAGRIETSNIEIAAFLPGTDTGGARLKSLSGDFTFTDLDISYFKPVPPLRGVVGTARFDLDRLDFTVTSGSHEDLVIEGAEIRITDIGGANELMAIDAVLRGGLAAALTLLDRPPLELIAGYGIDPKETSGEMAARLAFRFPLLDDLRMSQVEIAAAANARNVSLPGPAAGLDIGGGDLTLQLDGKGMEVVGTARVGPAPGQVSWRESFDPSTVIRGEYSFSGILDGEARVAFGLDTAPYLEGPVEADLIYTLGKGGQASLAAAVNLAQTSLELSELGWRKPAGAAGSARGRIDFRDGRPTTIKEFNVVAGDLTATGSGRLESEDGALAELRLDRFTYGRTDIAGTLRARAEGGFDLDITGKSFDAAPFVRGRGGEREGPGRPFAADLRIDRVWVGETESIDTVAGRMVNDGTDWRDIDLDARLAGKEFTVRLAPEDGHRVLAVRAGDAGAAFKAIGITDDIRGGQLEVVGRFDDGQPGNPLTARIEAKNFRLVEAPIMTNLLSLASITAPLALLGGEGINFIRLEAPFRLEGDRLEIGKGRAYGNALGVTGEGLLDLAANTIDMKGTIVPSYTVNRVLGAIPLVGTLLTGGEGEGVFAANYGVSGTLEAPKVSVNPLSVLAPGFLRNLFGGLEGGKSEPTTLPDED